MWLIYLLLILTKVTKLLVAIGLLALIAWAVCLILQIPAYLDDWEDVPLNALKRIKNITLKIAIPFLILGTLIPNSKEAAIIFSVGNTIEYVQNNEKIKELPDKAVLCLDKFISEYLEEDKE